mmetsp:Transcript_19363/g.48447  ORF Transcript_19363/g.48447 Transcript_19363/m.48447 type:complete len:221 (-) Transcript_19363:819-1481(-)
MTPGRERAIRRGQPYVELLRVLLQLVGRNVLRQRAARQNVHTIDERHPKAVQQTTVHDLVAEKVALVRIRRKFQHDLPRNGHRLRQCAGVHRGGGRLAVFPKVLRKGCRDSAPRVGTTEEALVQPAAEIPGRRCFCGDFSFRHRKESETAARYPRDILCVQGGRAPTQQQVVSRRVQVFAGGGHLRGVQPAARYERCHREMKRLALHLLPQALLCALVGG